ncbi:type II toxin-antitoxin system prevent-host-death family antitoxin [Cellulomonas sp. Leaf334]|uniref:type II toxin-antitoxin system prevent-host-death family antitoxin n=1 Tax=Cellulomonas sp. Leaf334 TaxID=1736339 RepID=UPI00138F4A25|nr:type II toxin-antitoxin system prevent-host-death family antitoxin [Cellulomonas sp. Leaf334]
MIAVKAKLPRNARPGRWVRVHEIDLPESVQRLPIGKVVTVRDARGSGDHRAVVDQVDRDDLGRRYWLLLIAPRVELREAKKVLGTLVDHVVASDERITITRRGKPMATMIKWLHSGLPPHPTEQEDGPGDDD